MNKTSYILHRRKRGGGGGVLNTQKVRFGMIKLGKRSEKTCTQKGIWLYNEGTIIFEGSTLIGNGCKIEIKQGAQLSIGENTGMTGCTTINCYDKITLGKFFSCAWDVSISDTDFHECYHIMEDGKRKEKPVTSSITIGDYVWICKGVTILKGTNLPDWCTVGANSLVTSHIKASPYDLIAGIPANNTGRKIQRKDLSLLATNPNFIITKGLRVFG